MSKTYRCIALFSGGLDSLLSIKYMEKLGYEVIPIFFQTPFFPARRAMATANAVGLNLRVVDISERHLEMVKNPRYGFGKQFNPCIDCHGLMFRIASEMLEELHADFLISGEVVGQRPMSQRKTAMNAVGKLSGVKDLLIRPLSQQLLDDTLPIREGWVRKEDMLDFHGRGRGRQIAFAAQMGIKDFQTPAGGCMLTDVNIAKRLKDLVAYEQLEMEYIRLLGVGRHLRLNNNLKLVVGRDESENERIEEIAETEILLHSEVYPGPVAMINSAVLPTEEELVLAASIMLYYNKKAPMEDTVVYGVQGTEWKKMVVPKASESIVASMIIK